jgi:hypothetical protein
LIETADVDIPAQRREVARVERAVVAFHGFWQRFVAAFPAGDYAVADGIARARTGLPVAPFNSLLGLAAEIEPAAVLAAVDEFAAGALPWNLQLRPGYSAELAAALSERGLVETEAIPFMVLPDVERLREAVPAGADLRTLESFTDLASALELLERGFGMPPALTRHLFPIRMFSLPGVATSILRADDVDVSTALGALDGDICGVFNVATPEEHRRRGFGAIATVHAVLHAARNGATSAYLQSSPMGFSVYERLGFDTVEHWQQWMPQELVAPEG